ncbi:MAG: hypothetical protein HZB50_17950 [Chloroflexi bacterium]|nr:hypothetical protein [Chloroflexota bacterium]
MQRITPTNFALAICILLGSGFLAYGYYLAGFDVFVRWFMFFGLFWLVALYNRWDWFSAVALILTVLASALGLWLGLHSGWMIAASIFSLVAWDLTEFHSQIRAMPKDELKGIERRRLARLSLLALIGLLFASLLLLVRGQFTLDWQILLVVMAGIAIVLFFVGRKPG